MLTFDIVQTDKHSTKICAGGKIEDFSPSTNLIKTR